MGKFGKWIGGGLGWTFGGPIGMIIGFAVGAIIDNTTAITTYKDNSTQDRFRHKTNGGDFGASLLVLAAAVMKADGKVMKSEVDYVKSFFLKNFGEAQTLEMLKTLKQILNKDIPLEEVCGQIRYNMQHPMRLQLLHFLFGISMADGKIDSSEITIISTIARYLGISIRDFESIKAMFYKDTGSAYKILEIESSASDDEVKKAYRKMAIKYHPDKVVQLGEEYQKGAKEKFQNVQEAYETIKRERGIK